MQDWYPVTIVIRRLVSDVLETPMKKIVAPLLLASALFAVPASAEIVHQTSVSHGDQTVSVSYQPRTTLERKQTGIGPRANASCLWTTRVSVERSVVDSSGKPIAALTRVVGEEASQSGVHLGHCAHIAPERTAAVAGGKDALRAFVAETADRDASGLRTELASLDHLRVADAL